MRIFPKLFLASVLLCPVYSIAAPILALDLVGSGTPMTDPRPFTVGWAFEVVETIKIGGLGFWDEDSDGLDTSHLIRVWTDSRLLLESATVDGGDSAVPSSEASSGQWIFDYGIDLVLAPGSYVIGADGGFATDAVRFDQGFLTHPSIKYVEAREDLNHGFPRESFFGNAYFGPNLLIESAVPATPTLSLLLLSLVCLMLTKNSRESW